MSPVRAAREPLLWLVMTLTAATAIAADTPQSWLDRMNAALTTRNYEGVFSHWQSGRVETLRIVHRVVDGAVTGAAGVPRWLRSAIRAAMAPN